MSLTFYEKRSVLTVADVLRQRVQEYLRGVISLKALGRVAEELVQRRRLTLRNERCYTGSGSFAFQRFTKKKKFAKQKRPTDYHLNRVIVENLVRRRSRLTKKTRAVELLALCQARPELVVHRAHD